MMAGLAAAEVLFVFGAVVLFIWRLQLTLPDLPLVLLASILLTFVIHRDRLVDLGLGSKGLWAGLKMIAGPTLAIAGVLVVAAIAQGNASAFAIGKLSGVGRYFAWCLLQQFVLQSFFANRLLQVFREPRRAAWINGVVFAAVHLPNPVLVPVTFLGGYILTRVFFVTRNLLPLALAHAIVGSLLAVSLPIGWHHGLRVGPGYYRL
jgi:membrane protease YdiL (CAAX protease family)